MSALFKVIARDELGLQGIAYPPDTDGGSMHISSPSYNVEDCPIKTGEVILPEGYSKPTYSPRMLQFRTVIVNIGDDWILPNPDREPEKFSTWPCENPLGKLQLKEFVIVTFRNAAGKIVPIIPGQREDARMSGLFTTDVFKNQTVYECSNRFPFGGQRIQMDFIPDGQYEMEVRVNPVFGECEPAKVWIDLNQHDIKVIPEMGILFPEGLVWRKFDPLAEPKGTQGTARTKTTTK